MALAVKHPPQITFDLKSATLTLIAVALKTSDLTVLAEELPRRLQLTPELFSHNPVVIDLSSIANSDSQLNFPALLTLLRTHKMLPVAVRGGNAEQMAAALAAGLGEVPVATPIRDLTDTASSATSKEVLKKTTQGTKREAVRDVPVRTLIIDKPLRSGQQAYAKGGDLIMLAAVNFGAEVIADGSIHVYGPLRGKAIAGAKGDTQARIFSTCLEPELMSIAGTYRTTENPLPAEVLGKPGQIRLDGEQLMFEPLN